MLLHFINTRCNHTKVFIHGFCVSEDSFLGDVGYIGNVKVKVDGNVTETLTDITLSGEGEIEIKYNSIKMEFLPMTPSNFKPGLLYMAFVSIYYYV